MSKTKKTRSRTSKKTFDLATVNRVVKALDKSAGKDDAKFLEGINRYFRGEPADKTRSTRAAASIATRSKPSESFHIYKDPRFLKNARTLARRTQGGVRVIGGTQVPKGEFLDCVAIGSDAQWGCTGTLIGPNVVITAGHCCCDMTRVFVGSDVLKAGKIIAVKKAVRHPKYHKGKRNDLMVLILAEKVKNVTPRKIAPKALIDKATDGRVVGFGSNEASGRFGYGVKRQVDVPVASPRCAGKVDGHDDHVSYGCDLGLELVAGRPLLERDSCNGDSGGPFYIADSKGRWLIAAATSRATDSAVNNCGDGGIYPRLDAYRSWIESIPGVKLVS